MELSRCRDCQHEISQTAVRCPHCGCEQPTVWNYAEHLRKQRVEKLSGNGGDYEVPDGPLLSLHIIPGNAMELRSDCSQWKQIERVEPLGGYGEGHFDFSGYVRKRKSNENILAYVQVFRNGSFESVASLRAQDDKAINFSYFEGEVTKRTAQYLPVIEEIGGKAPLIVLLSLAKIDGYWLRPPAQYFAYEHVFIRERELLLPAVTLPDFKTDIRLSLRNSFDMIWNASGFRSSFHYDENGQWRELR